MEPQLSRRVGHVMTSVAVRSLPRDQRSRIPDLVEDAREWADLPQWLRDAVEEGEREQAARHNKEG